MTTTDTNLQNLIINDIPQSDYESITPNANELYLTDEVIESSDITTALGYTPYNASNPAGYTSNVGTVTSVNGIQPVNGNVALTMPTIDQTFDGTSANAQSGVAINGAGFLKNTATGTNSLTLLGNASTYQGSINIGGTSSAISNWSVTIGNGAYGGSNSVAIGVGANYERYVPGGGDKSVAIGYYSRAYGANSIAVGAGAVTDTYAFGAVQIGAGTNSTANSFNVGFCNTVNSNANYQLLDGTTGKIPNARLNTLVGADGTNAGTAGIVPAPTATDNTKFLKGDGTWAEAGGGSRNVGEIVASTLPLTDAGLHLLDGALIDGSGIYADFVDYISNLDLTANYFCTEAEWQQSVTDYGVCGKFVYDSTNNTVRLPKITGILEGTTDVSALGDLIEAGLPNITGSLRFSAYGFGAAYYGPVGAFGKEATSSSGYFNTGSDTTTRFTTLTFDASDSNSIYGNSTTVQPQTVKAFYYIVIATSTKTEIQVDIDEIATDLNNKVDRSDLEEVQCVVETYQNGASWYRIWSDGWCEQGGSVAVNANSTVTFLKEYASIPTVTLNLVTSRSASSYDREIFPNTVTTTQFTTTNVGGGAGGSCRWQACGYIEV